MSLTELHVLVVDDDEDDFLIIRDLLESAGAGKFQVHWVATLGDGVRAIRENNYDVCLVDQLLGADRGLDLVRAAAREGLRTPIILLTGNTSDELDQSALEAGAYDFLVKGRFDAAQLSRSIRYVVEGARAMRRLHANERRYRLLFEKNPGAMWVYDPDTLEFIDVNEAACLQYGYSREEFLGMTLLDIRPEEDREAVLQLSKQSVAGLRSIGVWRHLCKDGSIRHADVIRHDVEFDGRKARISLPRDVTAQVKAQQALEEANAQHERLLEDAIDAIVVIDEAGIVQFANGAAASLFGRSRAALRGGQLPQGDALMGDVTGEATIHGDEGTTRIVEPRTAETRWGGRQARMLMLRDHTDLHHHRQQLALLDRAIESSVNGVVICDASSEGLPLLYANQAFERITGYSVAEAFGRNMRFLQEDDRDQPALDALRQALAAGSECDVVLRNYRKDGTGFWNHLVVSPVLDARGKLTHFIGVQHDITQRVEAERALRHAEQHDAVTGLPNYASFESQVAAQLSEPSAASTHHALLFIDLDRFHSINESMGHTIGDAVLREIAGRIVWILGDGARVSRYAGDEFIAAIAGKTPDELLALGEALRETIAQTIEGDEYRVFLTASIGLSWSPDHGTDYTDLLRRAELAMVQAKTGGRDSVLPFSMAQMIEQETRLTLGGHLRDALRANEFTLHYQPIVCAQDGRMRGFEALLRWRSPSLGDVSPARFIPVAESLGLMPEIGRWVIDAACRQARAWLDAGHRDFSISVNVSALELQRPTFVSRLAETLTEHRIPPGVIDIELTESALMEHVEQARETLVALKDLGLAISLDDFGTGYSSLAYLRSLPLDKLKIDRSFVKDLPGNEGAAAIARSIVGIAHELGMRVCAEGVETPEHEAFLASNGCDECQGYLFGRPVPPEQAVSYFTSAQHPASRPNA